MILKNVIISSHNVAERRDVIMIAIIHFKLIITFSLQLESVLGTNTGLSRY